MMSPLHSSASHSPLESEKSLQKELRNEQKFSPIRDSFFEAAIRAMSTVNGTWDSKSNDSATSRMKQTETKATSPWSSLPSKSCDVWGYPTRELHKSQVKVNLFTDEFKIEKDHYVLDTVTMKKYGLVRPKTYSSRGSQPFYDIPFNSDMKLSIEYYPSTPNGSYLCPSMVRYMLMYVDLKGNTHSLFPHFLLHQIPSTLLQFQPLSDLFSLDFTTLLSRQTRILNIKPCHLPWSHQSQKNVNESTSKTSAFIRLYVIVTCATTFDQVSEDMKKLKDGAASKTMKTQIYPMNIHLIYNHS